MADENKSFFQYYVQRSYNLQNIVLCLKEFTAVLVQLVCFSRLGPVDLFNGGVLLYMILVVFAFPFLNSYLFGFLRFGMWWVYIPGSSVGDKTVNSNTVSFTDLRNQKDYIMSASEQLKSKMTQSGWFMRTFIQFFAVTLSQVLGAYFASLVVKESGNRWPKAMYHSLSDKPGNETAIMFGYGPGKPVEYGWLILEEFSAVFVLLIGLLHLIHKFSPKLLNNAYWVIPPPPAEGDDEDATINFGTDTTEAVLDTIVKELLLVKGLVKKPVNDEAGVQLNGGLSVVPVAIPPPLPTVDEVVQDRMSVGDTQVVTSRTRRAGPVVPMFPLPNRTGHSGSNYTPDLRVGNLFLRGQRSTYQIIPSTSSEPPFVATPSTEYFPVPAELILHASLFVVAVSRAFPSAHQSLHLSIYFWYMGLCGDDEFWARVGGGYVACIAALVYYWFWYVYAGKASHIWLGDSGVKKSWARRNFLDVGPAIFRTELQIPDYSRIL